MTHKRRAPVAVVGFLILVSSALPGQSPAADEKPLDIDILLAISSTVGSEVPTWSPDGRYLMYVSAGHLMALHVESGRGVKVPVELGSAGHFLANQQPRWSPDGGWISYVSDKHGNPELWLYAPSQAREFRLTDLGGRINAYQWAPDGRTIVLSGDRYGNYDIWTVSVPDGSATRLTADPRYEVFPTYAPDGRSILYVRLDDSWADHDVFEIPASGGESNLVAQDRDFFDYGAGAKFGYPFVSPTGEWVLFRSHRSGWINYWVVPRRGGEARPVAPESADQNHARWSPDGRRISFISNRNGTHSLRVVSASGGEVRTVVAPDEMGVVRRSEWSPDGRWISYTVETPTRPEDLFVVDLESGERRQLTESMPLGVIESRLVRPRKIRYQSSDGWTISAYLYVPPGAPSSGHRYPGLLWIHGGPTSQFHDTFAEHVQFFVQRGYVVLMPNIRGSSGFGKEFEDANNGCWGRCDLEDVVAGVEFLAQLDYVDGERMGIHGTSYGGIMSMAAASFAPGVFEAAVPHAGYADWIEFYHGENELRHIKLLEYELGELPEHRETWERASAITGVEDVATPLFLVHGEGRYPGSPQSRIFAEALERHYKPFWYKTYPNETYYVRSRENRRQMLQDMLAFFDRFLKGPVSRDPRR